MPVPDGCPVRVVEYKCPWKHRDLHPKQAFLTPGICGIQNGNNVVLKSTSNYYSQVQLQMFVSELTMCTFVVWTNKGIFTVEVLCDPGFMSVVCTKLEKFWTSQVLPFLISVASMTFLPSNYLKYISHCQFLFMWNNMLCHHLKNGLPNISREVF
ncbi:uncharacterized protein [Acropora muricata]|uniref:uncharacterized protein n=1 Tax=Acropora muricata TaxID=159855 RepID=UPI0034E60F9A